MRLAVEVEAAGCGGLVLADHQGSVAAPFVALAAAAAVTERVRLGPYVANAGTWDPLRLASEVATLDLVSGGRVVLGIGAGHTPSEWTMAGRAHPSGRDRVERMVEVATATQALLAGDPVSFDGRFVTLCDAHLEAPRSVQDHMPLLVGGNGTNVLRFAAAIADVVGVTGLGRTLADGHHHTVDWGQSALRRLADLISSTADRAGRSPQIDALVQHVEITDDAEAAAVRLVDHLQGATTRDLLECPFVWLGTPAEIRDRLQAHRTELGITRYTVREPALPALRDIFGRPAEVTVGRSDREAVT